MTFDDAARARIAGGWASSPLDQPTYAAQHGISARTLREWVSRYGTGRRPQAQLRAAVVGAIEQLQNVLAALDAEAADDSAAAHEDGQEPVDHQAERRASSAGAATPARATPPSPVVGPLASQTTLDAERAPGARGAAAVCDNESPGEVPEVAGAVLVATTVAVVDGAGGAPAPPCSAAGVVGLHDRGPSAVSNATSVLDFEALRYRAAQRRAARATSGTPRRNHFLDWDSE